MLLKSRFLALAATLLAQLAAGAPAESTEARTLQGAAACTPSKSQPYSFSGVLVVKGDDGYYDETSGTISYLAAQKAYDGKDYLYYRREVKSVYKSGLFDGAIATPCDAFRSRVSFSDPGYAGVDAYEVGILRRSSNPRQCLQMVPYNPACQNDICDPSTGGYGYGYKKRTDEEAAAPAADKRRIFGFGMDLRWEACPTTDAAVLANYGQFLFAWLYNSTAQADYPGGPLALTHPRVFVHRANEITNPNAPFAQNGYSLGNRRNGSAVLVGTAYKSNFDPIQLINAFPGLPAKTQAEVEKQTSVYPYVYSY